jgi:hypothetical protein
MRWADMPLSAAGSANGGRRDPARRPRGGRGAALAQGGAPGAVGFGGPRCPQHLLKHAVVQRHQDVVPAQPTQLVLCKSGPGQHSLDQDQVQQTASALRKRTCQCLRTL